MIRDYTQNEIQDALSHVVPPAEYNDWLNLVMDAKALGADADQVEAWSATGPNYQPGEVHKRWPGIKKDGGRNGGGLINAALAGGWNPQGSGTPLKAPPPPRRTDAQQDRKEAKTPAPLPPMPPDYRKAERTLYQGMDHAAQRRAFLQALFGKDEYINLSWEGIPEKGGKFRPASDLTTNRVGDILDGTGPDVLHHEGYDHAAGVWVRVNPVCEKPQGGGGGAVADTDVSDFRYTLIESDDIPEAAQLEAWDRLRIPVAAVVASGKKSVHAIVKIEAQDRGEYDRRVRMLHDFCKSYGIPIDPANKNPSRYTRLPGITRGDREQVLLDVGGGCRSWEEFQEFMEDAADGLPLPVALEAVTGDNLPPKRPELISGVLRCGHILLVSGGSKSGKSFLLQELCLAVASGGTWLGRRCKQGRALYINLEVDPPSLAHRFQAILDAAKISPGDIAGRIDIWNLRGVGTTLPQIVKSIERKARRHSYDLIVIDPIYKVLGKLNENDANDVGELFGMFDQIARITGASVCVCHHHAKGMQAARDAKDRPSGSSVFSRSPDAVLDALELETTPEVLINAGFSLGGVVPIGLQYNWVVRDFPPCPTETGFFCHPLHLPDVHNALQDARTMKEAQAADARRKNLNKTVHWYTIINDAFDALAACDVSGDRTAAPADTLIQQVMERAGTESRETVERKIREAGFKFRRPTAARLVRTVERKPEEADED